MVSTASPSPTCCRFSFRSGNYRRKISAAPAQWDYILIDTPPTLGILTLNALTAAREVIVPVAAHVLGLAGVAQLKETIAVVRERLNPDLTVAGIVASRVDSRTRHCADVVASLRETFGSEVYATEIRENIRLAEAPSFKRSILEYSNNSPGAADYRALAEDVIPALAISPESVAYYASLISYYAAGRLLQLDRWVIYLYLLCFIVPGWPVPERLQWNIGWHMRRVPHWTLQPLIRPE